MLSVIGMTICDFNYHKLKKVKEEYKLKVASFEEEMKQTTKNHNMVLKKMEVEYNLNVASFEEEIQKSSYYHFELEMKIAFLSGRLKQIGAN